MEKIVELIDGELQAELEALDQIEFGGPEHEKALKSIDTLLQRRIDIAKIEKDEKVRIKQFEDEQKDRKNRFVLSGVKLGTSVALALLCLHFEEHGSISGFVSRIFMNEAVKS